MPAPTERKRLHDTAVRAARAGGRVLMEYYAKDFRVDYKGEVNLVTEADRAAEETVLRTIRSKFPDHDFLAEESGAHAGRESKPSPYRWVIDPLDGTTNFAHAYPVFCVSIGLEFKKEIVLGAVYDPIREELFTAEKGRGARLNARPVIVSRTEKLDRALLVTGFSYDVRRERVNNIEHFKNFSLRAQGVRRTGSAALDLCYVACGRLDGFWELRLSPWDTAAGFLIATEAGATVTDFFGRPYRIDLKEIVASNGRIHPEMLSVLRPAEAPQGGRIVS